jgi:hypothetical protein
MEMLTIGSVGSLHKAGNDLNELKYTEIIDLDGFGRHVSQQNLALNHIYPKHLGPLMTRNTS